MEIRRTCTGPGVELRVSGRVDGFSAEQLKAELDSLIREGDRDIRLDLSGVPFLSSAGIGLLVKYRQDLARTGGSLVVSVASPPVHRVLEMARLSALLIAPATRAAPAPAPAPERAGPLLEVELLDSSARLRRRILGDPDVLRGVLPRERRSEKLTLGRDLLAAGIGAFGSEYHQCCDRFGDFLAAAGAAAYMPNDGSNVPDSLLGPGEMVVVYGIACQGGFSHRLRFRLAALGDVIAACRRAAGEQSDFVLAAESGSGGVLAVSAGPRLCAACFSGAASVPPDLRRAVEGLFQGGRLSRVGRADPRQILTGYCWVGGSEAAP